MNNGKTRSVNAYSKQWVRKCAVCRSTVSVNSGGLNIIHGVLSLQC